MEMVDGTIAVAYGVISTGYDGSGYVLFGETGGVVERVAFSQKRGHCR